MNLFVATMLVVVFPLIASSLIAMRLAADNKVSGTRDFYIRVRKRRVYKLSILHALGQTDLV